MKEFNIGDKFYVVYNNIIEEREIVSITENKDGVLYGFNKMININGTSERKFNIDNLSKLATKRTDGRLINDILGLSGIKVCTTEIFQEVGYESNIKETKIRVSSMIKRIIDVIYKTKTEEIIRELEKIENMLSNMKA